MSGKTAEYSYLRMDSPRGNAEAVTDPFERALLDELFSEGDENWACIGTGDDGEPVGYSYSDFDNRIPAGVHDGQTCYLKKKIPKTYQTFHVGSHNFILPEGSAISKSASQVDGDGIVEIADTNENGVPDSGDTGLTRSGRRVDDLQLTSPVAAFEVSGSIYESDIEGTPSTSAPRGEDMFSLLMWGLTDAPESYDVTPIEAGSALDACVAVGNSSQDYMDGRAEEAREMGAAITDNPVLSGGIAAVAGYATLWPIGRAAMTGVAFLGSIYGAISMIYDRARGIHDYAAGRAAEMILGRGDLESMLWMSGAGAFKGMTVTEAINAPVRVADAAAAKLAGIMPKMGGGIGGGMVPAMAYAGGGIALDAEVAVAAATLPGGPVWAGLFPAAMAMSAEGAISIDAGNGGRKFIDTKNFPARKRALDDWSKSKSSDAKNHIKKLLDRTAEYHMENAVEAENVGKRIPEAVKRMDEAMGRLSKFEKKMEVLETIYRHAPDDLRVTIDAEMEAISRTIKQQPESLSLEAMAELTETQYRAFSRHVDDVINAAEGSFKTDKGGGIIYFLNEKLPVIKTDSLIAPEFGLHPSAMKSASKNGLMEKYLWDAVDILLKRADTNGNTGASIRWSLKGHPDIGEVRFLGPGKRVYFSKKVGDGRIYILECGKKGGKKMQDADIARAQSRFDDLAEKFEAGKPLRI